MDIRKLTIEDVDGAYALVCSVIEDMRARGIEQWDEVYPDRATLALDVSRGEAYGCFDCGCLAAYVALNEDEPPEYGAVLWTKDSGPRLVIHRLCVDPGFQGRGIAKEVLSFAERFARESGRDSIRLDAFSKNPAALRLYEKQGYSRLGTVTFRKGLFFCYEKVLG